MTISSGDRDLAVEQLMGHYKTLADEIGQVSFADDEDGWKPDIDNAELRLGGGGHRIVFYALCQFYALDRFTGMLAARVDTEAYAVEGDRATVFDNAMAMRKSLAAVCAGYGYPVDMTDLETGDIGTMPVPGDGNEVGDPPDDDEGGGVPSGGLTMDRIVMDNMVGSSGEW